MEVREDVDSVAALTGLVATSPSFLGIDGLHYVNQLRRLAEQAGLNVPPELTVEEMVALGADWSDDGDPSDPRWCPFPGQSDIIPVRELRESLRSSLFEDDGREASARLTAGARNYGLTPALTADDLPAVATDREDVAGRLASRLIPAAMELVSRGLLARVRLCADPWCRSPFIDRTRNGSAASCSPRCSERVRKRRYRERCFQEAL
jgi:hypothetical protein